MLSVYMYEIRRLNIQKYLNKIFKIIFHYISDQFAASSARTKELFIFSYESFLT